MKIIYRVNINRTAWECGCGILFVFQCNIPRKIRSRIHEVFIYYYFQKNKKEKKEEDVL